MQVNYNRMFEATDSINKVLTDIVRNAESIEKLVSSLDNADLFKGNAYVNYNAKTKKMMKNINAFSNQVSLIASKMSLAAEKYQNVDKQVMARLNGMGK